MRSNCSFERVSIYRETNNADKRAASMSEFIGLWGAGLLPATNQFNWGVARRSYGAPSDKGGKYERFNRGVLSWLLKKVVGIIT